MKNNMILSIIAILISVLAIILVCTKVDNLRLDWNAIIGVLSILVTVLIGWQIWNVINFEDRMKSVEMRFEERIKRAEMRTDEIVNEASNTAYRRSMFMVNLETSSVYMQERTSNPNAAILHLAYSAQNLESLQKINMRERDEIIAKFIFNAYGIINSHFTEIHEENLNLFTEELKNTPIADKRITELLLYIERKKLE